MAFDNTAVALDKRHLGDASKAWRIAQFNGNEPVHPGNTIVIPLRPRNAPGVHASGYQTVPTLTYQVGDQEHPCEQKYRRG